MHWKKSSIKSLASNLNEGEFRKIHYLVNIHRNILFYKRMTKPKESTNFVSRGVKETVFMVSIIIQSWRIILFNRRAWRFGFVFTLSQEAINDTTILFKNMIKKYKVYILFLSKETFQEDIYKWLVRAKDLIL